MKKKKKIYKLRSGKWNKVCIFNPMPWFPEAHQLETDRVDYDLAGAGTWFSCIQTKWTGCTCEDLPEKPYQAVEILRSAMVVLQRRLLIAFPCKNLPLLYASHSITSHLSLPNKNQNLQSIIIGRHKVLKFNKNHPNPTQIWRYWPDTIAFHLSQHNYICFQLPQPDHWSVYIFSVAKGTTNKWFLYTLGLHLFS